MNGKPAKNIVGKRFGRLVVIGRNASDNHGNPFWFCLCDCGVISTKRGGALNGGSTRSCGCLQRELAAKNHPINIKHGKCKTRAYKSWTNMKARCFNKKNVAYQNYGGRGIVVCERWLAIENFYEDMGDPPPGHEIDRIDNNGNYVKENCHWVLPKYNSRNRRNTKLTGALAEQIRKECAGGKYKRAETAQRYGVSTSTITRIYTGQLWV